MRQLRLVIVLAIVPTLLASAGTGIGSEPTAPIEREPAWELFLDDHIIERSTGFQRVLHHPEPRGVVLAADQLWETVGLSPQHVSYRKDGKLECYYRVLGGGLPGDTTGYAVSEDGIHNGWL